MQLSAGRRTSIIVNGEPAATAAASLGELLAELGYAEGRVATALNGVFVPRQARNETPIAAGDAVEIVAPRQGG
jgi:sulfur carrier protein